MKAVLGWIEGVEIGPHRLENLVVVAQMGLGVRLRGQHLSLTLHVEEWLGLGLAFISYIQKLQVSRGELGENATLKVVMLHPVGVARFRYTVWLLLPAAGRTWETANGSRRVDGDSLHRETWARIYPRVVDLYVWSL